jgi:hypothetical protein
VESQFVMGSLQMTRTYVVVEEEYVYCQIYVPIVKGDMVDLTANFLYALESPPIVPWSAHPKDFVYLLIIVHVLPPISGEINANSMNSTGKVKVEIGLLLKIGSSIRMVCW